MLAVDVILYTLYRVLLKMWNEMAEITVQHLKPNDLIYVSGYLGWYTKLEEYGRCIRCHEV